MFNERLTYYLKYILTKIINTKIIKKYICINFFINYIYESK
jgi:hypothetical protein